MSRYIKIDKVGNNYSVNPNASSGGGAIAYAWADEWGQTIFTNFSIAPDTATGELRLWFDGGENISVKSILYDSYEGATATYEKVSDDSFTLSTEAQTLTVIRDSTKDFTLWQLSE